MNKNILNNQEHREALQLEANRKAIEYHGEENFNKVHEALKVLTDAGINAIIFANFIFVEEGDMRDEWKDFIWHL